MSVNDRLDAIKVHKGIRSDNELAGILGISRQRLYQWRTRNVWDDTVVREALPELREEWVERGEGDIVTPLNLLEDKVKLLQGVIDAQNEVIMHQAACIKELTEELTKRG